MHYVTETVIASPERATLKHAKPAKCVITILVLSCDLQPIRTWFDEVCNKFLIMHF